MRNHRKDYLLALEKGEWACSKCTKIKPLKEFYFDKHWNKHDHRCKECRKKYNRDNADHIRQKAKIWRDRPERKERKAELAKASYWRNRELHMLTRARRNRRGLEFSLVKDDVIIPEICPIFKVPFDKDRFAPSLDRMDNTKGYTKENVRVISKLANTMKNSATLEELQVFCENTLKWLQEDIVQTMQ